ncbi:MAG: hypothetical protein KGI33_00320 [Thaumarchaeota archaeon]|nr:hypothetical protein [Nitrososphaerota archaeon]
MTEPRECEAPDAIRVRAAIGKILISVDQHTLEEIKGKLEELDIDMEYCCEHPDVLCSILKIAKGTSYLDLIRSVSG